MWGQVINRSASLPQSTRIKGKLSEDIWLCDQFSIEQKMKTPIQNQPIQDRHKSYQGSFINRLMDFFKRLPLPYWVTYLALFILHIVFSHIVSWVDGWLPLYKFEPLNILFPLWLWGPLTIMTYLDSISVAALISFKPLLDISDEEQQQLRDDFSTMPNRNVIISSIIWLMIYAALNYVTRQTFFADYGLSTLGIVFTVILGLPTFLIGSVIYYHSIRQLLLIHKTVGKVRQYNLFNLEPVYAFSQVTAKTGIAWIILLSLTLLSFPIQLATLLTLSMYAIQVLLAIAAFVLPVWAVHLRLEQEKRRLVGELNQRFDRTLLKLRRSIDQDELGQVSQLNDAISGLGMEREILSKIPTWPWRSGVFNGFLSAIVLPIVLWLLQYFIGDWMSR